MIHRVRLIWCVQVVWTPYESDAVAAVEQHHGLNIMCRRDQDLWRVQAPLICFYVVEMHLPHRVLRQYGRDQAIPANVSTSSALHRYVLGIKLTLSIPAQLYVSIWRCFGCSFDRIRNRSITDWAQHHHQYVQDWLRYEQNVAPVYVMHRGTTFRAYLAWFHGVTRYRLRQAWTRDDYAEIQSSDDENTPYDIRTREGQDVEVAPILDRVVRILFT